MCKVVRTQHTTNYIAGFIHFSDGNTHTHCPTTVGRTVYTSSLSLPLCLSYLYQAICAQHVGVDVHVAAQHRVATLRAMHGARAALAPQMDVELFFHHRSQPTLQARYLDGLHAFHVLSHRRADARQMARRHHLGGRVAVPPSVLAGCARAVQRGSRVVSVAVVVHVVHALLRKQELVETGRRRTGGGGRVGEGNARGRGRAWGTCRCHV